MCRSKCYVGAEMRVSVHVHVRICTKKHAAFQMWMYVWDSIRMQRCIWNEVNRQSAMFCKMLPKNQYIKNMYIYICTCIYTFMSVYLVCVFVCMCVFHCSSVIKINIVWLWPWPWYLQSGSRHVHAVYEAWTQFFKKSISAVEQLFVHGITVPSTYSQYKRP